MRSALVALLIALLAPLAVLAQQPAQDAPPTLDSLRGQSRVAVVFADSPNDPKFVQQMTWLADDPAPLEERRVVILTDTDPKADGPLRQRLRPIGFGVVLIDIDGSIATRRPLPTTVREISRFIDRMPSRRQEIGSQRP